MEPQQKQPLAWNPFREDLHRSSTGALKEQSLGKQLLLPLLLIYTASDKANRMLFDCDSIYDICLF